MPESREANLPDGMSDLLEFYQQNQKREVALSTLKGHLRSSCRRLAPLVFDKLLHEIDRDLLFAEDKELVLPKIREAACEVLNRALGDSSHDSTTNIMVEMLVEQTWLVIGVMTAAERSKRTEEE
jgi:hypothetical protein